MNVGQVLVNGVTLGSVYALVALGFSIIYGTTRIFHFAHGVVYAFGAYFAYWFVIKLGLPAPLGIGLAVGLAAVLGLAIDRVAYEPLVRRGASPLALVITSLGVFIVLENALALAFGSNFETFRLLDIRSGSHLSIGTVAITPTEILIWAVTAALFVGLVAFFRWTRVGIAVRALASDPEVAEILGMRPSATRQVTFLVGSALAGIAAILVSIDVGAIDPNMGLGAVVTAVVSVVIGGVGNMPAAAAGGMFLGLLQNLGIWIISSRWQDSLVFAVLILVMIFRPAGLLGRRLSRLGR